VGAANTGRTPCWVLLLALVLRGSSRDVDVLLSAVPRDALLAHPELAAALAAARIINGPPTEVAELTAAAYAGEKNLSGARADRLRLILRLVEMVYARVRGDLVAVAANCRQIPTIRPSSPGSPSPRGTWCRYLS
jgi:hypothetical protein